MTIFIDIRLYCSRLTELLPFVILLLDAYELSRRLTDIYGEEGCDNTIGITFFFILSLVLSKHYTLVVVHLNADLLYLDEGMLVTVECEVSVPSFH